MRRLLALALAVLVMAVFTGCGGSSGEKYAPDSNSLMSSAASREQYLTMETAPESPGAPEPSEAPADAPAGNDALLTEKPAETNRKLIRNVSMSIEALDFEKMLSGIQSKVEALGGYIESSEQSGNSYNYVSERYAYITVRIPAASLDAFIENVEGMGNVVSKNESVTDVTLTYVDMKARRDSLQVEYERLMVLLEKADSLESIIALESRLSEVRYEMESYESQLRTYDNLVDYSTVRVDVREVERITPQAEKGVWERIAIDFDENLYRVSLGLQDFFVWFVSNIPYLALWAVVVGGTIAVILLIVRLNSSERSAARREKRAHKKAELKEKRNRSKNPPSAPPAPPAENG